MSTSPVFRPSTATPADSALRREAHDTSLTDRLDLSDTQQSNLRRRSLGPVQENVSSALTTVSLPAAPRPTGVTYEERFIANLRSERVRIAAITLETRHVLQSTDQLVSMVRACAGDERGGMLWRLREGMKVSWDIHTDPCWFVLRKSALYSSLLVGVAGFPVAAGVLIAVWCSMVGVEFGAIVVGAVACEAPDKRRLYQRLAGELNSLAEAIDVAEQPVLDYYLRSVTADENAFRSNDILSRSYDTFISQVTGRLRQIESNDRCAARVAARMAAGLES